MRDDDPRSREEEGRDWPRARGHVRAFVRNVSVVAGGTALAQALSIAFAPFITRFYGPEAYGVLSVFMSVIAVLASAVTFSYPLAINLPKRDVVAYDLLRLSIGLACLSSTIILFVSLIGGETLAAWLGLSQIASALWVVPLVAFLVATTQTLEQWLVRNLHYRVLAAALIMQALIAGVGRVGFGWAGSPTSMALISLGAAAFLIQAGLMCAGARRSVARARAEVLENAGRSKLVEVAVRYRDFPFYRSPQLLLNTASRAVPLVMLTSLFGAHVAGFFGLAQSVLSLPIVLVSQSLGKVLLQNLATRVNAGQPIRPVFVKATLALMFIGALPFGVIAVSGPWLFAVVFGVEWSEAGCYARWLSLWLFFQFINAPAVQILVVLRKQKTMLIWEVFSTSVRVGALVLFGFLWGSPLAAVVAYSLMGGLSYFALLAISLASAREPR